MPSTFFLYDHFRRKPIKVDWMIEISRDDQSESGDYSKTRPSLTLLTRRASCMLFDVSAFRLCTELLDKPNGAALV